jgi:hypothetical protein
MAIVLTKEEILQARTQYDTGGKRMIPSEESDRWELIANADGKKYLIVDGQKVPDFVYSPLVCAWLI